MSSTKPTRPAYTVKVAETKDEIEACLDLRVEVFVVEQGFSLEEEYDEYDKEAVHILLTTPEPSPSSSSTASVAPAIQNLVSSVIPDALKSDEASSSSTAKGGVQNSDTSQHQQHNATTQKPIGTVRYVPRLGKLTRLVVSKEYRQFGFGKVLVLKLEEEAVRLGKEGKGVMEDGKVKVKIHSQVIPFYERLGYISQGERFAEDGAPHQKMVKLLDL